MLLMRKLLETPVTPVGIRECCLTWCFFFSFTEGIAFELCYVVVFLVYGESKENGIVYFFYVYFACV